MTVQFKSTGIPLFKSTGVVAMDPDCCCGRCPPLCGITAVAAPTIDFPNRIRVFWEYGICDPGDTVLSAEVHGVDVLDHPFNDSGELYLNIPCYAMPETIDIIVVSESGTSTCRYTTPCCWSKCFREITISGLSDIDVTCSHVSVYELDGVTPRDFEEYEASITGLSAWNGTYTLGTTPFTCGNSSDTAALPQITFRRRRLSQRLPPGSPGGSGHFERSEQIIEGTINPVISGSGIIGFYDNDRVDNWFWEDTANFGAGDIVTLISDQEVCACNPFIPGLTPTPRNTGCRNPCSIGILADLILNPSCGGTQISNAKIYGDLTPTNIDTWAGDWCHIQSGIIWVEFTNAISVRFL